MKSLRDQLRTQDIDISDLKRDDRGIVPLDAAEIDEVAGGSIFGKVRVVIKF